MSFQQATEFIWCCKEQDCYFTTRDERDSIKHKTIHNNMIQLPQMMWGVFSQDCYGFNEETMNKMLVRTFSNFNDALVFSDSVGDRTSIHLTRLRLDHNSKQQVGKYGKQN